MSSEDIYWAAFEKWGYDAQRNIWVEEMAELTQALMKLGRVINPSSADDVVAELVDVMLCVEQMVLFFSDGNNNIQERYKIAFDRFTKLVLGGVDPRGTG